MEAILGAARSSGGGRDDLPSYDGVRALVVVADRPLGGLGDVGPGSLLISATSGDPEATTEPGHLLDEL